MTVSQITAVTGFKHLTGLPCINLQFGTASAVVSLYGGQVLSYTPSDSDDVLWLSPKAQWQDDSAIRGGIPVCWPWFGPVSDALNPHQLSLPKHGLVRNRMWQIVQQHSTEQYCEAVLAITLSDFPHAGDKVTLQLSVKLDAKLQISVSCNSNIMQQVALHSYFSVENLAHTKVSQLPLQYHDKVNNIRVTAASTEASFNGEVDRIYLQSAKQLQINAAAGRTIALTQHGHDATVIWNPGAQLSQQMPDLADDSYQQFICVETARLQLTGAATLDLSQQISAMPLTI